MNTCFQDVCVSLCVHRHYTHTHTTHTDTPTHTVDPDVSWKFQTSEGLFGLEPPVVVPADARRRFELHEPALRPVRRVAENRATGLALGASRLRARALSPDASSSDQSDEDSASKVNIIIIPHTHTHVVHCTGEVK